MRLFAAKLNSLFRDTGGNLAIMFTIALIPILLAVNFAMDYSQASRMRADLQALADAVALAAVNKLPDEAAAQKAGSDVYNAGIAELRAGLLFDNLSIQDTTTPDLESHVTITGQFKSASGMTFNMTNIEFVIKAKAKIPLVKLEVAVAADATASMMGSKITALRTALGKFTDKLMDAQSDTAEVRLAIVPFSRAVTLPSYASGWFSGPGTTNTSGKLCATRRGGVYDSSDDNPDTEQFDGYTENASGCVDYVMQPLSNDRTALKALVNSLRAKGWGTANQVASEWVLRALSPKWASHWPTASAPNAAGKATKIAVLMTDGENETGALIHDTEGDIALARTCQKLKDEGITVYAVTFKTPLAVRPIYQNCVSAPENLIEASNDTQLIAAFERIAEEATRRLVKLTN